MKNVEITYHYGTSEVLLRERPADAQSALDRLTEGNRAFAALFDDMLHGSGTAQRVIEIDPHDFGLLGDGERAPMQRPYAAVLGCADARVPIELIFNEGPNDLFVVRVAGNGLGGEVLGSLKYAAEHLGESIKLIVVLGHSGCGAVSAAVDVFLKPAGYLALASNHTLRNILDRLLVVVHAAAQRLAATYGAGIARRPGYREALIEVSVLINAALVAYTLQHEIGADGACGLRAAYGVYLLGSRRVWTPGRAGEPESGLADAPQRREAFSEIVGAATRSERISALLASE